MKEKKKRRSQVKYPSLDPRYNSKVRQEYIDIDYVDELDDTVKNVKLPDGTMVTEREYMAIFMKEWNNAGVGKQSEAKKNKFHRNKKLVKEATDRNNHRNNDMLGVTKATNLLDKMNYEDLVRKKEWHNRAYVNPNTVEDAMIDYLDHAKESSDTTDDGDK